VSEIRRGDGEPAEVQALITDRYLDSLLTIAPSPAALSGTPIEDPETSVGAAVRAISRRLATDLPRFHPSFRFEERLALRLAQLAASMRLPMAAGGEAQVSATPAPAAGITRIPLAPVEALERRDGVNAAISDGDELDRDSRPLLIGGAVAASAISLAGAWLAWRRRTSPMARAVRAAHAFRQPVGHG
jgi:hypothetical protein